MTPDERKQRTLAIISEALKILGCELSVHYTTEQLGAVLQTRAQIVVRAIPDWTPPQPETKDYPSEDTHEKPTPVSANGHAADV